MEELCYKIFNNFLQGKNYNFQYIFKKNVSKDKKKAEKFS